VVRIRRLSIGLAVLLLPMLAAPAAFATTLGGSTGVGGTVAGTVTVGGVTFNGSCNDERILSPVGNGPITYELQAAGTATGAQVTQAVCFATQDGNTGQYDGGWTEGDAGALETAFFSNSADPVTLCWQVNAFLNGSIYSSGPQCTNL
jgi:hypothetical protein